MHKRKRSSICKTIISPESSSGHAKACLAKEAKVMAYTNIITIGNIDVNRWGQPRAEIILETEEGVERKVVGYITPFRDYRFQISMTKDGSGNIGATIVTPDLAENIRQMREDFARNFVWGQVLWAIQQYSCTTYGRKDGNGENMIFFPRMEDGGCIDRYVTAILRWAKFGEAQTYWVSSAEE